MQIRSLQMKRALRSVLLVLLLSAVGMGKMDAQDFTVGDLNYSVNGDDVSVTVTGHVDGESATGTLTIPETVTYEGVSYSVTEIGEWAFAECSGFTGDLIIPNSVTIIGEDAFGFCNGFTGDLIIPNSVIIIGDGAFESCNGFTGNLIIGNSVTEIGEWAFAFCEGFTGGLTIPDSVTSIGESAFCNCSSFNNSLLISNSVISIGNYAFSGCSGFTGDLVIPNSVTVIGEWAFNNCRGFSGSLTIPNSVTTIGDMAFDNCRGFTSLMVFPETPPVLGSNVFRYVGKSIPVYVPYGTVEAYQAAEGWNEFTNIQEYGPCPIVFADANVKAICVANWDTNGDGDLSYDEAAVVTDLGQVFRENTEITSFEELQYFTGLTTIGNYAFYSCSNLSGSLYIPNSVTSIGDNAFYNCRGFTGNLTIPNSVTTIGYGAFSNCSGFTGNLVIPNSVTTIGSDAFNGCSGFNGELSISNSVTTIGAYAFQNCTGFTGGLIIGNSVTEIGFRAFDGCSGFTEVHYTGDLEQWFDITFGHDANPLAYAHDLYIDNSLVTQLVIPETVTEIKAFAFCGATCLTSLTIPNFVTTIGSYAFDNCSGLTGNLTIPNSVTMIGGYAFNGCSGFTGNLTIPNSVTTIGDRAFRGCSGFTGSLTIGNSVTTIGGGAFEYCSGFTGSLTIGNSVNTIGNFSFCGCSGFTGSLTIPNSVITIGISAFEGCRGFSGLLTIGNSVITIDDIAFSGCYGLSSMMVLSEMPPAVGSGAFYQVSTNILVNVLCGSVEAYQLATGWATFSNITGMCSSGTVSVAADPIEGGEVSGAGTYEGGTFCTVTATPNQGYCFANWTKNGSVVSNNSTYSFVVTGETVLVAHFVTEGNIVFADDTVKVLCVQNWDTNGDGEISYVEAANVTNLSSHFSNNTEITSFDELQFFIGLTLINAMAFYECNNLSSITIPNSVTGIGYFAFRGCSSLSSITIPNSITDIGVYAFWGCDNLASVYYMGDIAQWCRINFYSLGNPLYYAHNFFVNNNLVTDLVIPDEITEIKSETFLGATCLTSLTLNNFVTSIGSSAFSDCNGITSTLTIPSSVASIDANAFSNCSGLTGTLTIPNSVTTIGAGAFYGCSGLAEVMLFKTTPVSLGNNGFYDTNFPIYVPYESLNAYKTATNWSDYEDRIFPMTYTTIPGYGEGEGNYRFIASPLVENTDPTTVDNMITETAYDLYRFDQSEDAEWQNFKANTENFVLENGQGYLYANAEEVNVIFKGNFNEDETKEVGLVYDANADFAGWNLVGNPFPVSAYANKNYYTMNEDGTAVEPNMVSSGTPIPACTGIMVMAEAEGETIVFSTEAPETAPDKGCLQIVLSQIVNRDGASTGSGTLLDKAIVSFNTNDRLEKFVFNKDKARISIPQNGKELAIACTDKQGELPLNFKATKNGQYTIAINADAVELDFLHLIDNLTGADIDLLVVPSYTFEAKTTDYASRFRLVFSANEKDGPSTDSRPFAFVNNGNIIVNGEGVVQIVDVMGRAVRCTDVARNVSTNGMVPGVYVLRLINGNDVKTQKIVIE